MGMGALHVVVTPVKNYPGIWSGGEAQSARGVHPAARPPRLSTAAAYPAPEAAAANGWPPCSTSCTWRPLAVVAAGWRSCGRWAEDQWLHDRNALALAA